MILVNANQMRSLDAAATELGIDSSVLMENAAIAMTDEILKEKPESVLIFTGKGQNAGDGFACARHLYNKGINTEIIMLAPPESLSGSALKNYEIDMAVGIKTAPFSTSANYTADVIVDCILGSGFKGELSGDYKDAVCKINSSGAYVIAADIPSGISADNGKISGICVKANKTVTFGFAKLGLYSPLSIDFVGEVAVKDISIPKCLPQISSIEAYLLTKDEIFMPAISKAAHKGTNGRVAIAGGSDGKLGAVILAQKAALYSGAGLVTCLVPERLEAPLMTHIESAMCAALEEADFSKYDSVLNGNGLGTSSVAYNVLQRAIKTAEKTIVIDADGINLLAENKDILKYKKGDVILTPHPLEFARLCGLDTSEVIENRVELASEFAQKYGVTVVLKGAYTVVASSSGKTYTNTTGNEGMAKGGSGDVLAGMTAGLAPKFENAFKTAFTAVYLHGLAGDIAAEKVGKISMTASDIAENISDAFKKMY